MPVVTEPVLWRVVLALGAVVSSGVAPGTEVDDAPAVGEPRPEVLRPVPGTALPVAVVVDSIPVVTEVAVVGLLSAVPGPRKQVPQYVHL